MSEDPQRLPDWERLLAAERHLQYLVPGAVLVGGTAAALHLGHRQSMDGDHVVSDLRERLDEALASLEAVAGWSTVRVRRPVLSLGKLDGILTGIRQFRRTAPLETELIEGIRVPTLAEMARIKAWLLATRATTRDYLDTAARPRPHGRVLTKLTCAHGSSPLSEVAERLGVARPTDLAAIDLASYRGLVAPWNDWRHVAARGRFWAPIVAKVAMEPRP